MLMRKLGKSGIDVFTYLEEKRYPGLIIHTEDEFDPPHCMGLLSVKGLAKGARLGWQGRSPSDHFSRVRTSTPLDGGADGYGYTG